MFKQMKNIDTAFRHVRSFTLAVIVANALLCGFILYRSHLLVAGLQDKVYILFNGKVLEAYAAEREDNIPVEARDHVTSFHLHFFTLDPDDKVIRANVGKALYLADATAKREYDNLRENNFYSGIISGNISQRINVDSVYVNTEEYPYYFRCYATQSIIRITNTVTRALITEGYLRNVRRSDNNPHGFLIERWRTIENRDIHVKKR
jgi:conjugative transposon TraK protein